ncbi:MULTISPECIES: PAAR domain-containing protein [unclassified Burkholderia]|uniref:PAAR domain-containing protein n=1 Tax=unclassified Burkholderia TaxID=2613784 RepID=UPI001420CEAB|nr:MULTISPECIES: PAAR domain-containing protein [unclassified Burkholderia]NIE58177.1 PAAR domain-containing protein [Burkholderia sp. Ap-955]NIF14177.1 PAAR domain-containing protein [Burkholderia sp. Ax-1735]NIG07096.1 PAAR domain-containing protein [Burkholderia sp. Tr-849]
MRKAAVRDGDPTTTRGSVIAHASTIYDGKKKVALDGEKATCGTCRGAFKIVATGKGISENGRNVVVDGDIVMCPCGDNRVLVGSNPGIFLQSTRRPADLADTAASTEAKPSFVGTESFDDRFVLYDPTGVMLPHTAYAMQFENGSLVYGTTDQFGRTHQIESGKQSEQIKLYIAG